MYVHNMTINLTTQESEEYFYNALCNGLSEIRDYGLRVNCNKEHYTQAKAKLTSPCYEDILMQMLRDGNTIGVEDFECDGAYSKQITLEDVHDRMPNVDQFHLLEMINENDDAGTADVIIQTVFFDDIIFG